MGFPAAEHGLHALRLFSFFDFLLEKKSESILCGIGERRFLHPSAPSHPTRILRPERVQRATITRSVAPPAFEEPEAEAEAEAGAATCAVSTVMLLPWHSSSPPLRQASLFACWTCAYARASALVNSPVQLGFMPPIARIDRGILPRVLWVGLAAPRHGDAISRPGGRGGGCLFSPSAEAGATG